MKKNAITIGRSTLLTALITSSAMVAQANTDDNLLSLLQTVKERQPALETPVPAEEPPVVESVAVDTVSVAEPEVVVEPEPVIENPVEVVDRAVEMQAAAKTPIVETVEEPEPVLVAATLPAEPVEEPVMVEPVMAEPVSEPAVVEAAPVAVEPATEPAVVEVEPVVVEPATEPAVAEVEQREDSGSALERVLLAVQAGDHQTIELEESADLAPVQLDEFEPEPAVDDLGMASYDESSASTVDNLISVRLNKVGLEEAINLFAQLSGANIIVPELTEAAQVSVNLKDVEWRPALQSILDSYNYELYQRVSGSNVYSVRRRPAGAPEPQVVETFKLDFATVPNAAKLIKQLLPEDAKVSEFASRNMIVVKSTESSLSEVRAVLATIDTVRQQVYIESKFMELSDGAQKDLGFDWQMLEQYSVGASQLETKKTWSDDRQDTKHYMVNPETGAYYLPGTEIVSPSWIENPNSGLSERFADTIETFSKQDLVSKVSTAVLDADSFRLMLSALESSRGVNIVSNPKIIVANEELANISIVEKEPNLKQSRTESLNDTGDNITFELDSETPFFEYGVKLDVIPSINTSSNITVKINPALTRKEADKVAGNNTYPIISEKSIQTVFSLTSGQTAAIGGLTEVTEKDITKKVPILGEIPLLGRLFSWEQKVNGQDETIIFVTVGLANTQQIDTETGLPQDSELARRRVIHERNDRSIRKQGREYFGTQDGQRLEDTLRSMQRQENRRLELRARTLLKEQERQQREAAKRAEKQARELALN